MYLQFRSVKEQSKNRDIWVWVLFGFVAGRVLFGSVRVVAHILLSGSVWFLTRPGFWFDSFLQHSSYSISNFYMCVRDQVRSVGGSMEVSDLSEYEAESIKPVSAEFLGKTAFFARRLY